MGAKPIDLVLAKGDFELIAGDGEWQIYSDGITELVSNTNTRGAMFTTFKDLGSLRDLLKSTLCTCNHLRDRSHFENLYGQLKCEDCGHIEDSLSGYCEIVNQEALKSELDRRRRS